MEKVILQKLILSDAVIADGTEEMVCRSRNSIICSAGKRREFILKTGYYDFSTYFNSLSLGKWEEMCAAERFSLELDAKGEFGLDVMGHYADEDGELHKEWLGKYSFQLSAFEHIVIDIPVEAVSEVVSFQITAVRTTHLLGGCYCAMIDEQLLCSPRVGVRIESAEAAPERKTELFLKSRIFGDEELGKIFAPADGADSSPFTHFLTLKNGSFYTQDSFRRLAAILRMQRPEKANVRIVGSALNLKERNHVLNSREEDEVLDLNRWDAVIHNEMLSADPEGLGFLCAPAGSAEASAADATAFTMSGICCWREKTEKTTYGEPSDDGRFVLQKLMVDSAAIWDGTQDMYYRSEARIVRSADRSGGFVMPTAYYDFSTYFNSFSLGKWRKYTNSEDWRLELDIKGSFSLDLMGHYVDAVGNIHKEWLGSYSYDLKKKTHLSLPLPGESSSIVAAFQITARSECRLYDAYYSAKAAEENIRDPFITFATTTFKKEDYVRRNIKILESSLFSDPELAGHFSWKIIDNGRTLDPKEWNTDYLEVIPNDNVGGSGGFCRGIIEALSQKKKPTHVLLMDDDVYFMAESFRRVYMLLKLLKPQYDDYFISGAMLEINQRNIQHEDVGMFRLNGEHGPSKPRYDLNLWDSPIRNEVELKEDVHQYSGWWYCCVPTTVAREDNLPLPFFIRGDDVEYSIRNHARFITMNGICIWHEGFGTKFSGAMELYQVHRNDLILQTMNDHIADIKVIERIQNLFWEEVFKFNYKGCDLLLDAVEDFLKGPAYLKTLNGEACMKEHRAKDNQLKPITDEVRRYINYETLYDSAPLTGMTQKLYGHFVNGQKLPEILCGKKVTVIPYGWGYSQTKLYRAGTVYAIDPHNDLYVEYRRDRSKFRAVTQRYERLMARYSAEYEQVAEAYRAEEREMESKNFWMDYLNA